MSGAVFAGLGIAITLIYMAVTAYAFLVPRRAVRHQGPDGGSE